MKFKLPSSKVLTLALMGVLLLVAIVFVIRRAGPLAPVRVTVVQAVEGSIAPALFGVGTVEARRSYLIGPTSAGRVLRVLVDAGDTVKAGQLLAEMDGVDLEQRMQALDATVARAGSSQDAARAQVSDATARREVASLAAKRNQDLAAQSFISAGALEARLQEKVSADAALQTAQANLGATGQDLARIQAERAALAQQRGNVRLLAPADGVVISRDAEAGSTVVAGQPVLRLVDPGSLWVKMRIDQGRSAGLATGLPARIVLRSQAPEVLAGQVARVELVADSVTEERIAQVTFDMPGAGSSIGAALGELAEVTLQLPGSGPALLIPNASVQRVHGQVGVWRLQDGKPAFAAVRLGASSLEGQVQVLHGLQAGDTVVVYSQKALSADSRVQVVEALVKAAPPGTAP